jgi:hypothetical protein
MIAKDWPQKLAGYTPKQGDFWYDSEAAHLAIDFFPRFCDTLRAELLANLTNSTRGNGMWWLHCSVGNERMAHDATAKA